MAIAPTACQKKVEKAPEPQTAATSKPAVKTRGEANDELQAAQEKVKVAPNFNNFTGLGLAYSNLKDHHSALAAFQKAVEFDVNSPIAHNNICSAFIGLKDWKKARTECEQALKLNPKLEIASNNLKSIDESIEKLKKDIEEMKKAMSGMKNDVLTDANLNIGYNYFQIQDYETAMKYWSKVSKKDSRYAFALNNMATVNIIKKKFVLAEKQLNEAEKIDPRNTLVRDNIKWLRDEIEAAKSKH
ncbi:MAG: tetratricopeptide repeat protein [Bdellovibrionales bacterium]|nr:tetratricopeptide repeat protein [Bdellovibrionales bacterium]